MKTNNIILTALLIGVMSYASAQERVIVTESISKSFEREYTGASNVAWGKADLTTIASFTYQNNFWVAYYRDGGEKFACGRKIRELEQLPLNVQQGIIQGRASQEKKFGPMQSSYAMEMIKDGTTTYYLPMENSRASLVLAIDNSGNTAVVKKHLKLTPSSQNADLLAKKN